MLSDAHLHCAVPRLSKYSLSKGSGLTQMLPGVPTPKYMLCLQQAGDVRTHVYRPNKLLNLTDKHVKRTGKNGQNTEQQREGEAERW